MLLDDLKQTLREMPEDHDLLAGLNECVTIDLQNVADYLNASKSNLDLMTLDVAPPFPSMWLEWKDPCSCCNGAAHPMDRLGMHAWSLRKGDPEFRYNDGLHQATEWLFFVHPFVQNRGEILYPPSLAWCVSKEGRILFDGAHDIGVLENPVTRRDPKEYSRELVAGTFGLLNTVFMGISLMHCKNVQIEKALPHPERLQQSRRKKGKLPLVRWHRLIIGPVKKTASAGRPSELSVVPNSLHICRGHFKEFTEKALFGKTKGRWWWASHKRGSVSAGIVQKEYEVRPAVQSPTPASAPVEAGVLVSAGGANGR